MTPRLAYALTRMQARLARRPGPAARRRLLAIGDPGHFMQSAEAAGLAGWLEHLTPTSDVHAIELSLRLKLRDRLDELASWLPDRWRPLMNWLARAVDLPVLDQLRSGGAAPAWLRRDPALAALVDESGQLDCRALRQALYTDLPTPAEDQSLDELWLCTARGRLPRGAHDAPVDELLLAHLASDFGVESEPRIERAFRRAPAPAARVLAFALLLRRDFEFLRGQLGLRRLQARTGA